MVVQKFRRDFYAWRGRTLIVDAETFQIFSCFIGVAWRY